MERDGNSATKIGEVKVAIEVARDASCDCDCALADPLELHVTVERLKVMPGMPC